MRLTDQEITSYRERGYLLRSAVLSAEEVRLMRAAVPDLITHNPEATLANKGNGDVRLVFGPHQASETYAAVMRLPRVLEPARQLLGGDVYAHQTKVTLNTRQGNEGWVWHQDYAFWRSRDRVPGPDILSAAVFLDDVTHVNGPLFIVPGSHRGGLLETEDGVLDRERITEVCTVNGIDVPTGPAGSVLYFHGSAVHGSPGNITPFDRRIFYITYNAVSNAPESFTDMPPEYVSATDHSALSAVDDSALLAATA
ncbi:phytanoyl-CoA dioxygenase family protein [Streptomyces sp. MNU76]|uniref:phytanoyl-CoA dioxygenase family protein n=1 Tax=Streptomyces sp. MNU76 TaxID=2560026 RepID=UPI001E393835|nr:phytanoyl-CoA dioxygenase family protein [Streptomyces sp. MNU76]MCC9711764.1 phytanoyl-CoA dioxygenase family protein [Streptomyces sp. MNU76]